MSPEPRVSPPGTETGNVIRDSALGLVPETVSEIITLNGHIWRDSLVSPSLLEIIRLRNARTVNCVFCKSVRYDVARQDGLTEDRAAMVADGYDESALSDREKAAIALADSYLGFPAGMDDATATRVQQAFSSEEVASMLTALMTFNFTSRTAVSIGGMPEDLPVTEVPVTIATG
ncbi:carboxymuconolactone decarboxylase family protein [Sphingomonas sp. C3-2]|uniref:carboxymuconolactone decarboxylase family protein n=1 Tax=Sphingomonas sp. C3-2 TaxID=3062169 RepID=UPI00294B31D6|nr:carboxymuconolactone decarboxylase family protein [Sphingomonas sp. C3-2]WOK35248.1 carboxymuconolactone decarboxylase family protein [Sphingomonas sp. C3-2]